MCLQIYMHRCTVQLAGNVAAAGCSPLALAHREGGPGLGRFCADAATGMSHQRQSPARGGVRMFFSTPDVGNLLFAPKVPLPYPDHDLQLHRLFFPPTPCPLPRIVFVKARTRLHCIRVNCAAFGTGSTILQPSVVSLLCSPHACRTSGTSAGDAPTSVHPPPRTHTHPTHRVIRLTQPRRAVAKG